jgi:hypothetical protein
VIVYGKSEMGFGGCDYRPKLPLLQCSAGVIVCCEVGLLMLRNRAGVSSMSLRGSDPLLEMRLIGAKSRVASPTDGSPR